MALKALRLVYIVWATLVFSGVMVLFLPFILIPPFFGSRAVAFTYFFMRAWSWLFSKLLFIRYQISGASGLKKGSPCIYVSNHTSFLDLPGLCMMIPGQFRPLAKKELLKIPVFGWVVSATTIVVDRSSPESRKKSLLRMTSILKNGIPALIFPEGTQNRTKELLQPFRDGAFRIALDVQVPIIPVTITGAGQLMPPGTFSISPGTVHIHVGEPITVESFEGKSVTEVKDLTFERMEKMLKSMPS